MAYAFVQDGCQHCGQHADGADGESIVGKNGMLYCRRCGHSNVQERVTAILEKRQNAVCCCARTFMKGTRAFADAEVYAPYERRDQFFEGGLFEIRKLERECNAATHRACRLHQVYGASVLTHHGHVALRHQVPQVQHRFHMNWQEAEAG